MINYRSQYVDNTGVLVWSYYYFGMYSNIFGKVIVATYNGEGKLHWFILMHDSLFYEFGDMPFDWELDWFVNYPRSYK